MTKILPKRAQNPILIIVLFLSLVANGLLLVDKFGPVTNLNPLKNPRSEVLYHMQNDYIGAMPDSSARSTGEIKGLVESLKDPYSEYLPKSDAATFQDEINERYQGIGVRFKMVAGLPQITKVLSGSPAQSAGLQVKDVLVKVEDTDIAGLNLDEVADKVRGPSGSSVKLTVSRDNRNYEYSITRAPVQSDLLSVEFMQNTAVISLTSFGNGLDEKMREVANQVASRKAKCQEGAKEQCVNKIILDLRSNTGGLLDQAVDVSSYFLPSGSTVLYEKTRQGSTTETTSQRDPNLAGLPLYILVDKYTASSSEVVAAALSESDGAKLVGQKTFGKGVVQKLFTLSNGDTLKLTIAEWLTPKKNQINKVGLKPDIEIKESEDALEVALKQ